MRDKIVKRSFKFSQVLKIEHDSIGHDFMMLEKVLFRVENFSLLMVSQSFFAKICVFHENH